VKAVAKHPLETPDTVQAGRRVYQEPISADQLGTDLLEVNSVGKGAKENIGA